MSRSEQGDVRSEDGEARSPRAERADPPPQERVGYLAFVAHEMRNPLSTALWSAELLARLPAEERAGPRGEKLSGMCLRTLTRLRHLVEDHFLAERLAIGGMSIRSESVSLAEVVAVAAGRAGARCEVELEGATVVADRPMLERAIEALLAAAAREGAGVQVTVEGTGGGVVAVRVRGAPPLPDPFRAPDRSTPSDPTGRVLGLPMALLVAQAHRGGLRATGDGYVLELPTGSGGDP